MERTFLVGDRYPDEERAPLVTDASFFFSKGELPSALPRSTMPSSPLSGLAYNLYLKHDVLRVAQAFRERSMTWLLLKGASLAEAAYGGIAQRPMVDTDILVPPSRVREAHRLLRDLGFRDRAGNELELNLAADYEHPMHYPHRDVESGLELHWHIYPPESFHGDVAPFFRRAVTRTVYGLPVLTLNNEDRLLQLATHWAQHGLDKPSVLRDIQTLWNLRESPQHHIDVRDLVRRLRQTGARDVFALALTLLESHGRLLRPVPAELRSRRAEAFHRAFGERMAVDVKREDVLSPQPSPTTSAHWLRLLSWGLLTPTRMAASVRRELLPSPARLERIAGRALSSRETVAWFVTRQTRAARRLFGHG